MARFNIRAGFPPGARPRIEGLPGIRFAQAVPRRGDRRELRQQFRAALREVRAEDKNKVKYSLGRLVIHRVPVARTAWARSGDRIVEFIDGTRIVLAVRGGNAALRSANWRPLRATYLRGVEPGLRRGWYYLYFSEAGEGKFAVLARVDGFECPGVRFRCSDSHWWSHRSRR
ncbi:MAG: hypothetical protein ACRDX8_14215 [Acidimicrobiales bacterium]